MAQQPVALEPGVQPGNLWSGAGVVDTANVTGLKSGSDDPIVVFTGTGGALMDFTYEADLMLDRAVAAGTTFRATANAGGHYTANINTSGGGQIKLCRPGSDLATYATPISGGTFYHLRVVTSGPGSGCTSAAARTR